MVEGVILGDGAVTRPIAHIQAHAPCPTVVGAGMARARTGSGITYPGVMMRAQAATAVGDVSDYDAAYGYLAVLRDDRFV